MTSDPDPFVHLPHLRDAIADPATSGYRSLDLTAMDDRMRRAGQTKPWRRTEAERETLRQATFADRPETDLWVFAYGSLMWDPAVHFRQVRKAHLTGYHRSFCLRSRMGRGSFKQPGLMAALDIGGACHGLVFCIDRADVEAETRFLWAREMAMNAYDPVFVPLDTPQGPVEALAFVINHDCENYMAGLSLEETAGMIARAEGLFGRNLAYLDNLADHFAMLDVDDVDFAALHKRARALAGDPVET